MFLSRARNFMTLNRDRQKPRWSGAIDNQGNQITFDLRGSQPRLDRRPFSFCDPAAGVCMTKTAIRSPDLVLRLSECTDRARRCVRRHLESFARSSAAPNAACRALIRFWPCRASASTRRGPDWASRFAISVSARAPVSNISPSG